MEKQRVLREAQKIAAKFSFWMVSGDINHLFGNVLETPEKKYELEIKFTENFPNSPPNLIFHNNIKELLSEIQLKGLITWTPESSVVEIINELKLKIQNSLHKEPTILEDKQLEPIVPSLELSKDEYITPDIDAFPPNFDVEKVQSQQYTDVELFSTDKLDISVPSKPDFQPIQQEQIIRDTETISVDISTELSLIQQFYAYDQKGTSQADLNVYLTITISKTFIIGVNFIDYPEKPIFLFPDEIKNILGDPFKSLETLKKWNAKKSPHIVNVLQELETKLFFIKDIEQELKKILGEYKSEMNGNSATQLRVHLLTYGFKEYLLDLDLGPYPKPPEIIFSPELQQIISDPKKNLNSYINWKENESEPVEIVREIAWLVDKNSRISFEIDLLKENYKQIEFDPLTETLKVDMKGKMKTEDLTFKFQINLPREYPMKMPEVKVLNEFELETHEKIKEDLQTSFKDFFNKWTPFSYLVDLFNLISEKIFEVSVVSCVICHQTIAVEDQKKAVQCYYCERPYHLEHWKQTIESFGKCGFCLKVPPPDMIY